MSIKDLLHEEDRYNGNGKSKWTYGSGENRSSGNVIAEYMYRDEHREPYLQVERTDTKNSCNHIGMARAGVGANRRDLKFPTTCQS